MAGIGMLRGRSRLANWLPLREVNATSPSINHTCEDFVAKHP